jgi:hypothetical protein
MFPLIQADVYAMWEGNVCYTFYPVPILTELTCLILMVTINLQCGICNRSTVAAKRYSQMARIVFHEALSSDETP